MSIEVWGLKLESVAAYLLVPHRLLGYAQRHLAGELSLAYSPTPVRQVSGERRISDRGLASRSLALKPSEGVWVYECFGSAQWFCTVPVPNHRSSIIEFDKRASSRSPPVQQVLIFFHWLTKVANLRVESKSGFCRPTVSVISDICGVIVHRTSNTR